MSFEDRRWIVIVERLRDERCGEGDVPTGILKLIQR